MTEHEIKQSLANFRSKHGYDVSEVKGALIDMDGTLYDSMPWHARAWHRMVSELGIKSEVEEFFAYEGMTGRDTINLLFQRAFNRPATEEECIDLYNRKSLYFKQLNKACVMPGALGMVKSFMNAHVTPVLVTGSGQASLLERLSQDFGGAFPANRRVTSHDVKKGKPAPEPYLKGLSLLVIRPECALVIENAPLGVESGVNAGIFTIAVNTGPIPKKALTDAGADLVFDSMVEFADAIPLLLNTIKIYRQNEL